MNSTSIRSAARAGMCLTLCALMASCTTFPVTRDTAKQAFGDGDPIAFIALPFTILGDIIAAPFADATPDQVSAALQGAGQSSSPILDTANQQAAQMRAIGDANAAAQPAKQSGSQNPRACWNGKSGAESGTIPGSENWSACPGY